MPTTTGEQLVTTALQLLLVMDPEDNLGPAQGRTGLRALRMMMATDFQLPFYTTPVVAREVFNLTANIQTYTIGDGGDFDTVRPIMLTGAGLLLANSSNPTQPTEIPRAVITDDAWEQIQVKTLSNALFTVVYYNPTYDDDLGEITL